MGSDQGSAQIKAYQNKRIEIIQAISKWLLLWAMEGIPIIMYHALLPREDHAAHSVHIPVANFEEQMKWLSENGYSCVSFHDAVALLQSEGKWGEKTAVLTFDDGYYSLYQYALPILNRFKFKATLFLTTRAVGLPSYTFMQGYRENSHPAHDRPLTWRELEEMRACGWAIEAHGCRHESLPSLKEGEMRQEISASKQTIEKHIGQPVRYFAYPFGEYNRSVLSAVKENYKAACSVHTGKVYRGQDLFRLPRIEINTQDTLDRFARKVSFGYVSELEKRRSQLRNFLYRSVLVKDILQSFFLWNKS